ncbi:M20 family metallopeptidase [Sporolactobacillus shoreicorticis]|uniref:M20 family metallopeptidase n=1 Tax=Sporolactobacillus shoreicorticis TaxID=1923877 RepID=A0ABW5S374_9BACL|nr:M20 family metallopeptidase [Sporolactobacillus shoreicorticis]MCO7126540.1 M20 family metallopeptidase [Sporolactobacillus shoreicorticis]
MRLSEEITECIEMDKDLFSELSERIWGFAELKYHEFKSSDLLCKALADEGFAVERGLAGLKTSFVGSYGSGKPVIAVLGEFDALAGLSQKKGSTVREPIIPNGSGHGCGHNLLGVGALAAAFAVKKYIERHHLLGTVRYYGCPAEENGSGKTFMVRAGCFNDVDAAFTWHPGTVNGAMHLSSTASIMANFSFKGKSSHASASPELGRSALDAVELMNVGVNYLREHIPDRARVHYAITDAGGFSPNVVQSRAEEMYLTRAEKPDQVKEIFERVIRIAEGAALMTETQMTYKIVGATHNLIPNTTLHQTLTQFMNELKYPDYNEQDLKFISEIYQTLDLSEKKAALAQLSSEQIRKADKKPIADWIDPCPEQERFMQPSTDVSDVSWNVPTAQCMTATWALGTPFHTWQAVSQGTQRYALNAALFAGKALACTAVKVMTDGVLRERAKQEFTKRLNGVRYECLIPEDTNPPQD